MKMFNKFWFPLIAIGLMAGLAAPPGSVLAGDLQMDSNTALTEAEEITGGGGLTASTDGSDGDPDSLSDDLNAHGSDLQELSGLGSYLDEIENFSLEEILVRMIPWIWLY